MSRLALLGFALVLVPLVPALASPRAQAEAPPDVLGRWDLVVTGPDGPYASWLELVHSGWSTVVGRFVGRLGSARPIARVDWKDGALRFAIPPQWEGGSGDLVLEAKLDGARLAGTLTNPDGSRHAFTATRAPSLRRRSEPRWGEPIELFDGRDLAGWTPHGGGESHWRALDGVLASPASGANLRTTRVFDDFRLELEFRFPEGGNSGVHLRGRYEVQILDSDEREWPASTELGGVYGFLAPSEHAGKGPGEWNRYEITLVGRRVTVVLNGTPIIVDQVIPGPTGGAIDADEAAPGPILLQGDHTAIEYRAIRLTPAL